MLDPTGPTPEEVGACYRIFIRALLDVTDNLVGGEVVHPPDVVVYDDADPYLVVAADKGTAELSDTANELAAEYGFWLGDAFASGGSAGYDHKALGITARGAWESVKWHFREQDVDLQENVIRVVGVGDMSGDVFGNGMLLSETLQLVAAFDHRNVFIDPNPDPALSFAQRRRLFDLRSSSWEDYDRELISPGGGVYSRQAKRIDLSPEAREALGTGETALTPNEVIRAILRAPVDLLWMGGIGTYIKASIESNSDAGDRSNDAVRIDANAIRAQVIGEGGNLGLTQLARIEYARLGGRVNTDFFDNSGGVHCSDREVNLKVLLGLAEESGDLQREGRDELVAAVASDVVDRILYDNFLQAQILSQETEVSSRRLEAYEDLMVLLEAEGLLDREIEQLPSTEELNERARVGDGLESPELAVLLAYAKRSLGEWLLNSPLPDNDAFEADLMDYFPSQVIKRFGDFVDRHPLRRDLVATIVANEVVNSEGITFVSRLMEETGAASEDVVRAYRIARAVAGASERWQAVESLVGVVSPDMERELLSEIDALVESIARWHLAHPSHQSMPDVVAAFRPAFEDLAAVIAEVGPPQWRAERREAVQRWVELGIPEPIAVRHVYQEDLVHGPDIIDVALKTGRLVEDVARVFFLAGSAFEIDWLEEQVDGLPGATRWHRRAIQTVSDDLVLLRRQLAEQILEEAPEADPAYALDTYLVGRTREIGRLTRFMRGLAVDGVDDVASVVVAIRRIRTLVGR
jgi:glutamate dehydrogenase